MSAADRCESRSGILAPAEQGDHDALDDELGGGDELGVARVFGAEPGFPAFEDEGFEGAFVIDEGGDDVAVARGETVFEDDDIAIEDVASDHGIAFDFEGEGAGAGVEVEVFEIDGDGALGFLAAVVGESGGNRAVEGDIDDLALARSPGGGDAQGPGPARVGFEGPFSLEGTDMISGSGHAAEAEMGSDFAEGRGYGLEFQALADEFEDLLLSGCQGIHKLFK